MHQAISTGGQCDLTTPNTGRGRPQARHPDPSRRAIKVLRRITDNPAAIGFDSVAREAGVARKTIYNHPDLLEPIRAQSTSPAPAPGMVMASFVPERAVRELRELTRRRTEIRVDRGREMQRLEKELEDSGLKLTSVLSDVTGGQCPTHPGPP